MRHTLQLNLEQQSIVIPLPAKVIAIQVLAINSNLAATDATAQGIRFALQAKTTVYSCFSFVQPATLQFPCFDVVAHLDGFTANDVQPAEQIVVSCEGIEFLSATAIRIEIEII